MRQIGGREESLDERRTRTITICRSAIFCLHWASDVVEQLADCANRKYSAARGQGHPTVASNRRAQWGISAQPGRALSGLSFVDVLTVGPVYSVAGRRFEPVAKLSAGVETRR